MAGCDRADNFSFHVDQDSNFIIRVQNGSGFPFVSPPHENKRLILESDPLLLKVAGFAGFDETRDEGFAGSTGSGAQADL